MKYMRINTQKGILEVEIHRREYDKEDLGGYASDCGSDYYAHFFSQTDCRSEAREPAVSRGTMTVEQVNKSTQQQREMATQTRTRFYLPSCENEREITPSKYFDIEMWRCQRELAATYIQNFIRCFLARKRIRTILGMKRSVEKGKRENALERARGEEENISNTIKRRRHPKAT